MAALSDADAAIVTEWRMFRAPDFTSVEAMLKTPAIFDGRNMYGSKALLATGLEYFAIDLS